MHRWIRLLALIVIAPAAAGAQAIRSAPLAKGMLSFDADATLGAFTGTTATLTGQMTGGSSLGAVRGWVEAPARSLTTKNDHRDRDMASSMEFDKYAVIRFDLDSVTAGTASGDSIAVTLHGRFTLHGQTRPAAVAGWAWITPSAVRFHGSSPVNVKDYGVGGLKKALGMLKMNEKILVKVDVTF